jgi:acyl-CoA synthetase (AMP-forming)/AMP-acid ligase II
MDAEHADLRALYMNEKMMRRLTYFLSCPEGVSFWVDVLEETHGTNVVTNLSMIETSGAKLFDAVRDKVAHFFRISDITQDGPRFMERMGTSEGMRIGTRNAMGPPGFDLWEGVEIHVKPINASVRKTLNIMDCDDCLLVGELFIRTDNMMKGYLQANQTFVAPFDDEGWWGSGDIAYIDADGKYYLVGRSKKTINIDGDEYDPAVIHDAWVEILTFAEEMLLVRDDNHLGTSQAPVLFCKAGSNSGVTTMEEAIDWIDDGLKEVDWESDTYKAVGLYSTFAVLFVDEFPRSGGRRKIDGPKVQRLFTSSVKPALMATGDIQENVDNRAVVFLKWNHLLDEYELLEWRSTEK